MLVLIASASCYAPIAPSGAPCSDEGDLCPGGQSCIRGTCRLDGLTGDAPVPLLDAFVPDGPPGDPDNDGIVTGVDNCAQIYNLDQHDEDTDGVGDACDNCPHVKNANQANTMEGATPDGVGDLCDPRPTLGGDRILLFLPLHVTPSAPVVVEGPWALDGDGYRISEAMFGGLYVDQAFDRLTIEASGTVDPDNDGRYTGLSASGENNTYFDCGYVEDVGPNQFLSAVIAFWHPDVDIVTAKTANTRLSGTYTIRMFSDSATNRITCTTIDSRGTLVSDVTNATALKPEWYGYFADDASVRLSYFIVFAQD